MMQARQGLRLSSKRYVIDVGQGNVYSTFRATNICLHKGIRHFLIHSLVYFPI